MLNPIFMENVHGRKHPGSWVFAEPKLRSYRKPELYVYAYSENSTKHTTTDFPHRKLMAQGAGYFLPGDPNYS